MEGVGAPGTKWIRSWNATLENPLEPGRGTPAPAGCRHARRPQSVLGAAAHDPQVSGTAPGRDRAGPGERGRPTAGPFRTPAAVRSPLCQPTCHALQPPFCGARALIVHPPCERWECQPFRARYTGDLCSSRAEKQSFTVLGEQGHRRTRVKAKGSRDVPAPP